MTTLLPESSFLQNMPQHNAATVPLGRVSSLAVGALHDDWERQVQNLRQLICELLVKNQQLRWALMEMKEHEARYKEGPAQAARFIEHEKSSDPAYSSAMSVHVGQPGTNS